MEEKVNNEIIWKSLNIIAKSSVIVFIGIAISKILGYTYRIIIARYFGPEVYGLFTLGLIVFGWLIAFSIFGLNSGLLRYISLYRGKKEFKKISFVYKRVVVITLTLSIFLGLFLFLSADFISLYLFKEPNLGIFLKIFSIGVPLSVMFNISLAVMLAYEKIREHSFFFNILQNITRLGIFILLIFFGVRENSVPLSYILSIAISLAGAYIFFKYTLTEIFVKSKLNKNEKSKITKEVFSYSWPFLFSGIIVSFFSWVDSFFIGYFLGAEEVGIYNAGVPIAALVMITTELFINMFFPLVTREYAKGRVEVIKQISKQVSKWIFIINLPLLILIVLFPGAFINLLFGNEYLLAVNSLRFLAIGMFFSSIFEVSNRLISMTGRSKIIMVDISIMVLVNALLNYLFIPRYGINGAAFATMISLILLNVLFLIQAKYYMSIVPVRRKMLNIFLLSLIPAFILLYLKYKINNINFFILILLITLFLAIYLFLIVITKSFDKNDFTTIKSLIERYGLLKFFKRFNLQKPIKTT